MQKKITHQFFIKLEKPYLEPNLEPLGQTPKQFFFEKFNSASFQFR